VLDSGLTYDGHVEVTVTVSRRPGWYSFSDDARAVAAAGKPPGWLPTAQRVVAELHLNVNRRGAVFVSAPERRDDQWLQSLIERVADASLAVYEELLDLDR
jgi:hypothetical protein